MLHAILGFLTKKPEDSFWEWFCANEEWLYRFESNPDAVFHRLSAVLHRVHPDLTFEFGPVRDDGSREFVVSAGGMMDVFPFVESLCEAAPSLRRWQVTKFRPRRHPLNAVEFGGVKVHPDEVRFRMYEDSERVGIVLFFDGYDPREEASFGNIGFLFLDEALGEFDVETKVGFIEFAGPDSEEYPDSAPIRELAVAFDAYWEPEPDSEAAGSEG